MNIYPGLTCSSKRTPTVNGYDDSYPIQSERTFIIINAISEYKEASIPYLVLSFFTTEITALSISCCEVYGASSKMGLISNASKNERAESDWRISFVRSCPSPLLQIFRFFYAIRSIGIRTNSKKVWRQYC